MTHPKHSCGWLLPVNFSVICDEEAFVVGVRNGGSTRVELECPQCGTVLVMTNTLAREAPTKPEKFDA